jgi:colanic acid biosynthesis glycosyl transferase WcaI
MQLARALAARGHEVLHLHSATFQTPRGALARSDSDPSSLVIDAIDLGEPFRKYSFVRRLAQERRYGGLLAARLADYRPDVVISANTPLDAQAATLRWAEKARVGFVFWLQDIYSVAIDRVLRRRLHWIGGMVARRFIRLERGLLSRSDAVVAITADFLPLLEEWRIHARRISVVENWAPLDEVLPLPKDNAWAREHDLAEIPVFLYAGTIGLKHDPSLLLTLAEGLPTARVIVVSEGIGADWLREHGRAMGNLTILPFQRFERLAEVLAAADVLVAILEPDAGAYSVPSKVLTSLAAGRAILAAIPRSNLAARTIARAGAGLVVDPGDRTGFVDAGRAMLADSTFTKTAAHAARAYAEGNFDISAITDRFEKILMNAIANRQSIRATTGSRKLGRRSEPARQEDL